MVYLTPYYRIRKNPVKYKLTEKTVQQTLFTSDEHGWEWIDIENPTREELELLAQQYGLHPSSVRDCLQPEHLPKYEIANNIVFIISRIYDDKAHLEADTIQELTNK